MTHILRIVALLAAVLVSWPGLAQTSFKTEQASAELLADRTSVAPGESLWVALALKMAPGWHTYWRTTGDSGFPTEIRWTLPEGVTAGEIQWPTPERIPFADLMNFGYHGDIMLLQELKVAPGAAPATTDFKADTTFLVCAEVCIPLDASFSLPMSIGSSGGQSTSAAAAIARTREALPTDAPWPVSAVRTRDALTFTAEPGLSGNITSASFFPFDDGVIDNAAPQRMSVSGDTVRLSVPLRVDAKPTPQARGLLVIAQEGSAPVGYSFASQVTTSSASAEASASMPLLVALLLAFLGGIILNVMPCVMPVLVMKALSFMSRESTDAAALRRDGLAYTAGVLVTFGALVGVLLGLRAGSDAIGWGFQLQSPAFVAALAFVMLALGLSLSGVFTIGGSFGVGQGLASRSGTVGSFFTGLLAVVVATPCTAPFMGAAIGFALTQPPVTVIAIFEALALGLAFPYLVISFAPGVAKMLPRPGAWMERLKQFLAFPLYGAAAWLIWVLSQQVDPIGLATALAGVVFIGFAGWLWGSSTMMSERSRAVSKGLAVVALVVALGTIFALRGQTVQAAAQPGTSTSSEAFSEARVAELVAQGRPVFVNFTAAWCLTCIVNERVALSRPEVVETMKKLNVAYLKADWTNRNSEIGDALHRLGRDGIPLYVLYGPKTEPKILPQVLTPGLVVEELNAL